MKNIDSFIHHRVNPFSLIGKPFNLLINDHPVKCAVYKKNHFDFEILTELNGRCIRSFPFSFDGPDYLTKKGKNTFCFPKEFIPQSNHYHNGKNDYSPSDRIDPEYAPRKNFLDKLFNQN